MFALGLGIVALGSCDRGVGSDTIEARAFVLRDSTGRVRGEWAPSEQLFHSEDGVERKGSVTSLRFLDSDGKFVFQAYGSWDAASS
jgi:hypothetical protein